MNLNQEEIKVIKKFLVWKYVRYEDVQLELIDHIASDIEDMRAKDPDLSISQALKEIEQKFGISGFSKIVREKEKAMSRFWRLHTGKCLIEFLKPPLLFLTIGIFSSLYFIQSSLHFHLLNSQAFVGILMTVLLITLCYKSYVHEEELDRYLFLKMYYSIISTILLVTLYLLPSTLINFPSFENAMTFSNKIVIISSLYYTLNLILTYIFIIQIPQGMLKKLKAQYFNLNVV